jgi:PEP-CTERM motif
MPSNQFCAFSTLCTMRNSRLVRVAGKIVSRVAVPLAVLIFIAAPIANGDSFGFQTFSQYSAGPDFNYACTSTPDDSLTTCTESGFDPFLPSCFVAGSATSSAHIGALEIQANLNNCNGGDSFHSQAGFFDTLTIEGYSGSGFIQYYVTAFLPSPFPDTEGGEVFLNSPNHSSNPLVFGNDGIAPSALFPFTAGKASLSMELDVGEADCCGNGSPGFDLSASISKVVLFDSNLNPLLGPAVVSATGVEYPVVAPEPSSLLLLGAGMLSVLATVRRKLLD